MMTIHWILLGLGMACIGLSFFLSGLEAGLVEVSRLRLRRMAREGDLRASRLLGYLDQPEDTLWTILAGNTVSNVILGVVCLYGLQQLFGIREPSQLLELSRTTGLFWACFFVGCLLFYTFCELLSKTLFRKYATRLSVSLSRLFGWVELLFSPMVELLNDDYEMPLKDMYHLADILHHADILLTEYSTLMIEGAIFDLPIINVAMYNYRDTDKPASYFENYSHIKRVIKTGACKNAYTIDQLIEYIKVYLKGEFPSGFKRLEKQSRETLENFKNIAGKRLDFEFINPSESCFVGEPESCLIIDLLYLS